MAPMDWLNYHHLYYFWIVAQEGAVTRAAARLRLTHSTLSTQLRALEEALGEPLFDRRGRRLTLTPLGASAAEYASEIFQLGAELMEVARGRAVSRRTVFRVGVVGSLPRTFAYRMIEPALRPDEGVVVQVRQDHLEELLKLLGANRLHLVLSDMPPPEGEGERAHTHLLGQSEILLYATPSLARRYRRRFPASLGGAPMVLPAVGAGLRRAIERWLTDRDLAVQVVCELDDAGMIRVFGACGAGLFPVRAALRAEVEETHAAELVGRLDGIMENYYAISLERRVTHPLVSAVITAARERLSAGVPARPRPGARPRRRS